jgi:hypothetical protein
MAHALEQSDGSVTVHRQLPDVRRKLHDHV